MTSPLGGGKVKLPKVFTERGLYMLATILKGPQAIGTTITIIDTFAQIKELTQAEESYTLRYWSVMLLPFMVYIAKRRTIGRICNQIITGRPPT